MEAFFANFEKLLQAHSPFAYVFAFLGGILVSFTPCIYPMIPVTVGYVTANAAGKKLKAFLLSLSYVFGMALVYSALGLFASLSGKLFGQISTHPLVYFIVGNIYLILGLSLLGLFEMPTIRLAKEFKGKISNYSGAFILGLISGLVVGPCTAPVFGALLVYVATKQNIIFGSSLLFVFAIGMGFFLAILGAFSGVLTSMPKSGNWLVVVKKVCGVILVAAAEYFFIKMGGVL